MIAANQYIISFAVSITVSTRRAYLEAFLCFFGDLQLERRSGLRPLEIELRDLDHRATGCIVDFLHL